MQKKGDISQAAAGYLQVYVVARPHFASNSTPTILHSIKEEGESLVSNVNYWINTILAQIICYLRIHYSTYTKIGF